MNTCPYDPEPLKDIPLGMFHCPECGNMILAGLPHLDYSLLDSLPESPEKEPEER